jgi:hypothetical protein
VVRKFGEGVQLQLLQLGFWLLVGLSLGYGLEFLLGFWLFFLGVLPLEKGELALVGYWSATKLFVSVKVKVLPLFLTLPRGWPLCLWLGDNIAMIVYGKI